MGAYVPDLLEPDPLQLDLEWVTQPKLYHELADELEKAKDALRFAELELEVVDAEVGMEIRRKDPGDFGVDKFTEDIVKKLIILDKRVRQAKQKVAEEQTSVGTATVKVRTAEHRKTALENLVQLKMKDYISEPRMPKTKADVEEHHRRELFRKPKSNKKGD